MIELKKLTKTYNGVNVVDDLTLTIKKGSVFGFLGPNGAGKTTTIKMLTNIIQPTGGSIAIEGAPPVETAVREKIGFMPETPYFYDHLTGFELMTFASELFSRRADVGHIEELLQQTGIFEARDRMIRTYSKGMRQRLGFAQALVNDPDYIFLDEPLDGLDPLGRLEMKRIILKLRDGGKTVFFNSHILSDVEEIATDIAIVHRGKLLYHGNPKEFAKGKSLEEEFVALIEMKTKK